MNRSILLLVLAAAAALAVVLALLISIQRRNPAGTSSAVVTEEQRGYLAFITVSGARMSTARNFLGDTVTYLDAEVTNHGARVVHRVDIQLEFHDVLNQVVLRERANPVGPKTSPLKPGETRSFQISFERLPADWNRRPPEITVVGMVL